MSKTKNGDEFVRGFGCALAILNHVHDQPTLVADTVAEGGFDLTTFVEAGCEKWDLDELRKCLKPKSRPRRGAVVRR